MRDSSDGTHEVPENTDSTRGPDQEAEAVPRRSRRPWLALWPRRTAPSGVEPAPAVEAPAEPSASDARTAPERPSEAVPSLVRSRWAIFGVGVLGALVLAIVAVGLHTALGPLRDTALAAHIEPAAARLYWIGVDGLIVIAIIAAMILRHDPTARRYALTIVGLFTVASGVLQYLHGLGWTTPDPVSGAMPPLPWGVVAVVATLVIGTIFCGTHLFVYVLRQLFPRVLADQATTPATEPFDGGPAPAGDPETPETEPVPVEPDPREVARMVYAACLDAGVELSRKRLSEVGRISERQAGYIKTDVEMERAEAAAEADRAAVLRDRDPARKLPFDAVNGSAGAGRTGGEA